MLRRLFRRMGLLYQRQSAQPDHDGKRAAQPDRRRESGEGFSVMEEDAGKFGARYLAFLETISQLRPKLHRYCSRMTGSITDGEDVVQDALFRAYRSLDTYDDSRPLTPWLFRIAHNQCIDFLRRRGVRVEAENAAAGPGFVGPHELSGGRVGPAIENLGL